MKEELQSKLVEILSSIQTVAGKAGDFAMEQLPDIAQQYVAYGRAWNSAELVLAALLFLVAVYGNVRLIQWMKSSDNWDAGPILMISCVPAAFGFVWTVFSIKSVALVWLAPKVWLLKEIAQMVK